MMKLTIKDPTQFFTQIYSLPGLVSKKKKKVKRKYDPVSNQNAGIIF